VRESAEKVLVICLQLQPAGTAAADLQVEGFAVNKLGTLRLEEPVVAGSFPVVELAVREKMALQIEDAAVGIKKATLQIGGAGVEL